MTTRDFITPSSYPHIMFTSYFHIDSSLVFLYHGIGIARFRLRATLGDVRKSMTSSVQAIQLCHNWKYQEVIGALAVIWIPIQLVLSLSWLMHASSLYN